MSVPIPSSMPAVLRSGDTATWKISRADYPASAGWGLTYTLINATGKIDITSAASGDAHLINKSPAITGAWAAGRYTWMCRASNGTDAATIDTGTVEILANLAALTTSDQRTHAQKTLDAIEAWIENHDPGVAEYEIAGRRMKYIAIGDLLKLRDQYRREVRGQSGKSGRIYLRF